MRIGKIKTGGIPLTTLALAGVLKPVLEAGLSMTPVGNGNVISGAVKLVGAVAVNKFIGGGTISNAVQIALAVDAVEDIIQGVTGGAGITGMFGIGGRRAADNW